MSVNPVEYPVLEAIRDRWSPYRWRPMVVEDEKLLQCLEAARWAASSFNDQPWYFIVAQRQHRDAFQQAIECLAEPNQQWAQHTGVLILTVIRTTFAKNNQPNRVALHDLGQAAAHLTLQATAVGLSVHQMAGVNLSKVRQTYGIPEGFEPQTGIAIGYADTSEPTGEDEQDLRAREKTARQRIPLSEQVFAGKWERPASLVTPT